MKKLFKLTGEQLWWIMPLVLAGCLLVIAVFGSTTVPTPTPPTTVIANWRIRTASSTNWGPCHALQNDTNRLIYSVERPVVTVGANIVILEVSRNYWVSERTYSQDQLLDEYALWVEERTGPITIVAEECNLVIEPGPFTLIVR